MQVFSHAGYVAVSEPTTSRHCSHHDSVHLKTKLPPPTSPHHVMMTGFRGQLVPGGQPTLSNNPDLAVIIRMRASAWLQYTGTFDMLDHVMPL